MQEYLYKQCLMQPLYRKQLSRLPCMLKAPHSLSNSRRQIASTPVKIRRTAIKIPAIPPGSDNWAIAANLETKVDWSRHKIAITIDITPVIVIAMGAELLCEGCPQLGHIFALLEYCFPHSGHLIKAISLPPNLVQKYIILLFLHFPEYLSQTWK